MAAASARTVPGRDRTWWLLAAAGVLLLGAIARLPAAADLLLPLGVLAALALGYANGANDVSKAIATLVGSGVSDYKRAILWGSGWTVAGALAATSVATQMLRTFSTGLLAKGAGLTALMALAMVLGAFTWVQLATRIGLPVSTTHAITGAVVGAGVVALGPRQVVWGALLSKVIEPLLASPLIALGLGFVLYFIVRALLSRLPLSSLHWLSAGATSFARGLNDTPKIVALAVTFFLVEGTLDGSRQTALFVLMALAMGGGSLIGGRNVTTTLAEKVTKLDHLEGLSANLATAGVVGVAANLGLPVSTTHVSSGAIIGIGLRNGGGAVNWKVVRDMGLAWVVTLPLTAGPYARLHGGVVRVRHQRQFPARALHDVAPSQSTARGRADRQR